MLENTTHEIKKQAPHFEENEKKDHNILKIKKSCKTG